MGLHYDAFISYKHAPADIAVAEDIQHSLEHFRIPAAIRKKTGIKKIERIFRDQEELEITSDLNENIAEALENADNLIVICSTSTKQSAWVTKEIEQFLKNHDRSHVFTVLVDGEPYDVIPEILLKETVTNIDENGIEHTTTRDIEPLSCDYRGGIKQARKTEIPRLAAALLGCSYDELVMRSRQYRRRRIVTASAIVAAMAVIAIGYLIWSNRQISANLRQARKNQAVYLANESLNALEKEDRILAVQLALAALPSKNRPDWPYTPAAECALSRAISAYNVKSSGTTDYAGIYNYNMRGSIKDFTITDLNGAPILFAYDSTGDISAWDLDEYKDLYTIRTGNSSLRFMRSTDSGYLAVASYSGITVYDALSGAALWKYEDFHDGAIYSPARFSKYLVQEDCVFIVDCYSLDDKEYHICVHKMDIETGAELWKSSDITAASCYGASQAICISKDGNNIVFGYQLSKDSFEIYRCDLVSGNIIKLPVETVYSSIISITPTDEGNIIVFGSDDGSEGSYDYTSAIELLQCYNACVGCYELSTGNTVWRTGFSAFSQNFLADRRCVRQMDYIDSTGATHPLVCVLYADEAHVYDRADGSLYRSFQFNGKIVGGGWYSNDRGVMAILDIGNIAGLYFDSDSVMSSATFGKEITMGMYYNTSKSDDIAFIVKTGSNTLQAYGTLFDQDMKDFETSSSYNYWILENSLSSADNYAVMTRGQNNIFTLDVYDLENKALKSSTVLPGSAYRMTLLGIDSTQKYAFVQGEGEGMVVSVDIDKGETVQERSFAEAAGKNITISTGGIVFSEDKFAFLCKDYYTDHFCLGIAELGDDMLPGNIVTAEFPENYRDMVAFTFQSIKFTPDSKNVVLYMTIKQDLLSTAASTYVLLIYNVAEEKWTVIDCESGTVPIITERLAGELIAVCFRQSVKVFDDKGELKYTIYDPLRNVTSMHVSPGEKGNAPTLYVLFSDRKLERYDASTGAFTGSSEIYYYEGTGTFSYASKWIQTEDELIIRLDSILNIVDLNEFVVTAKAQRCLEYDAARRMIICYSYKNNYYIKYFNRYSLEELISKGEDFLKGRKLSDTQKSMYGIDW